MENRKPLAVFCRKDSSFAINVEVNVNTNRGRNHMKKAYEKPVLVKAGILSRATAMVGDSGPVAM